MTRLPHDDQPLIQFLKQHRPIPPATTNLVEKQLMQWVAQERRVLESKPIFKWLITGALATAGLVTWHLWKSSPTTQHMATQSEELESFVIESWNGANEQLSYTTTETQLENAWFMLEEDSSTSKNKTNYK
jgi:hypothetical protein